MAMGGYQWTPIAIPLLWTLDITDISFVPRHHAHARARTHAHDLAYPESDAVMSKEVHKKKTFSYSHAVLRVDIRCPRKEGTKQWENTRAFTSRLGGNGCAA